MTRKSRKKIIPLCLRGLRACKPQSQASKGMMRTLAALPLMLIAMMAAAHQTPDGLQFNVPYLCNDGNTYVVHRCEKRPKFEACFYQTGTDSERYNTREAVVYQMTKVQAQRLATAGAVQMCNHRQI